MSELSPLIAEVEAQPAENTHVVVMADYEGIRYRCYPKPACDCMAMVMNGPGEPADPPVARVVTREEFIAGLRTLEAQDNQ